MSNVVKQLAQLGQIWWLSRQLRGTDHSSAGRAAVGLARINTPRAIQALAESLRDDREPVWNAALTALMQIGGEPAARVLLGAIPAVAPNVQTALIRALGELNPPDLAPRLLKLVRGKGRPDQHREAVRVIVKSDPVRAVNLFWEEGAATIDNGLRSEMEAAVRSLTNQDCIPTLVARLGRSPPRGNRILDKAMLSALVGFGEAAVGPLSARLAETAGQQTESEGYARRRALEALVRIGTSHAAEVLLPMLSSIDLQVAIGMLSDAELATLRKEDWMERLIAVSRQHGPSTAYLRTLSQFRDPQATDYLMEVVRSVGGTTAYQATAAQCLLNSKPTSTWPDDVLHLVLGIQDRFETVTVVDHPGDNAWEQQYKDGVGSVTHTEQRVVDDHEPLRQAAREELERRKGVVSGAGRTL